MRSTTLDNKLIVRQIILEEFRFGATRFGVVLFTLTHVTEPQESSINANSSRSKCMSVTFCLVSRSQAVLAAIQSM
jgi:hypothetical protein